MYYKVMQNEKIIDVLDSMVYLKHQMKHGILLLSDKATAQLFLSSDGKIAWHDFSLRRLPKEVTKYETVELVEISAEEYQEIKHLARKNII